MLKSLKRFSPDEAGVLLSQVAFQLMPSFEEKKITGMSKWQESTYDEIIQEIREKLKLAPDDSSIESQVTIYNFLSNEINTLVLPRSELNETMSRVGQKGLLRLDFYHIEFTELFKNNYQPLGIRPSHVSDAIRNPSELEHLLPEKFESNSGIGLSLFYKYISQDMCLLVLAERKGSTQCVSHAWRIYLSDIDAFKCRSPLDLFRSFIEKYGEEYQLGNKRSKIFIYEKIQLKSEKKVNEIIDIKINNDEKYVYGFFLRGFIDPPSLEIAMAFVLNIDKYKIMLSEHHR